jgi:hypothetical protein
MVSIRPIFTHILQHTALTGEALKGLSHKIRVFFLRIHWNWIDMKSHQVYFSFYGRFHIKFFF